MRFKPFKLPFVIVFILLFILWIRERPFSSEPPSSPLKLDQNEVPTIVRSSSQLLQEPSLQPQHPPSLQQSQISPQPHKPPMSKKSPSAESELALEVANIITKNSVSEQIPIESQSAVFKLAMDVANMIAKNSVSEQIPIESQSAEFKLALEVANIIARNSISELIPLKSQSAESKLALEVANLIANNSESKPSYQPAPPIDPQPTPDTDSEEMSIPYFNISQLSDLMRKGVEREEDNEHLSHSLENRFQSSIQMDTNYQLPRTLHFIWAGTPIKEEYVDSINLFAQDNPNYEVILCL